MLLTVIFAWIRFDGMAGIIAAGRPRHNVTPGLIVGMESAKRGIQRRGGIVNRRLMAMLI